MNVEIVGVVRDGKYKDVREEPRNVVAVRGEPPNVVYVPFEQNLGVSMTLYVRTVGDPTKVTA